MLNLKKNTRNQKEKRENNSIIQGKENKHGRFLNKMHKRLIYSRKTYK